MARHRRRGRGRVGRALSLLAFVPLASRAPDYARLLWALARDERVPAASKGLLVGAGVYTALPIDIVPDRVPLIGRIDDVAIVVLAVDLFLESVPEALLHEKLEELGLNRANFDRDLAQMRRVVPRPVRRLVHRLPQAAEVAAGLIRRSGVVPAARRWLTREEPSS